MKILLLSFMLVASVVAKANTTPSDADASSATNEVSKKTDIMGGVLHNQTKKPINSVMITAYIASRKEKTAITDAHGNYSFDDLRPGVYKLVFEKEGYKKITKEKVMIKTDDGFQLNIEMEEEKDFDFVPGAFGF
ncbi:MAG TPA: carboxypeptidase-like regulatory domain-containing protein [Chitinophagaceae bacterium]|jgi:hypothetical protein|nr:carboxypeptidase-like regulatory domain-containing protein [Chitinophagaceae bacterium]